MLSKKDQKSLTEAYLSASQKYVNVPHNVEPKQPDEQGPAETLEDRMQSVEKRSQVNNTDQDDVAPEEEYNDQESDSMSDNARDTSHVSVIINQPTDSYTTMDKFNKMVKTDLYNIFKSSMSLYNLVNCDCEFEPWMIQKISLCSENMSSIQKVMDYRAVSEDKE
jgi:hypothetical protein